MLTVGGETSSTFFKAIKPYTLRDVHAQVTCPTLVLYGQNDLYVSDGIQDRLFVSAFPNSRCYQIRAFLVEAGSAEHCQAGAVEQAAQALEDWVSQNPEFFQPATHAI